MLVYSLDIGGSSVKHGLVEVDCGAPRIVTQFEPIRLHSRDFEPLKDAIVSACNKTIPNTPSLATVSISTTGSVNRDGLVLNAGHFHGYTNVDWSDILRSQIPAIKSVFVLNDGRAATWGEYLGQRAERECNNFAHFVVGTGIGGSSVVRGALVVGDFGNGGYFGHLKIAGEDTILCSCGRRGCVEAGGATPAILHYYRELASLPDEANLTFDQVIAAAAVGDGPALQALRTAGTWLGVAIGIIMNILDPRRITVGGGVIQASRSIAPHPQQSPYFAAAVESARNSAHKRVSPNTEIVEARYGNDAGMMGVAALAVAADRPN